MNAQFDVTNVRLETERLILREWNLDDLDDLFEYASIPGVGENAGWSHHKDKEESLHILKMFIKEKKTFAVVFKENNKVIGSLGVEYYKLEDKLTEFTAYQGREIGYVISKDYWGRGLMPEAVNAVNKFLFEVLDYDFLLCGYYNFNNQSKRVQEKCGFIPYRKLVFDTRLGTQVPGILSLLINPNKNIEFVFSHPETLIYKNVKAIRIVGNNYCGEYNWERIACRAIVFDDGKILLSYEAKIDQWEFPGGGLEKGETNTDCVIRETLEETGYLVKVSEQTLEINEYYGQEKYINRYFVCNIIEKKEQSLTIEEKNNELEPRWISLEDVHNIFSSYKGLKNVNEQKRGMYYRELQALNVFLRKIKG